MPIDVKVQAVLYGALQEAMDKSRIVIHAQTSTHAAKIEALHEVATACSALIGHLPEGLDRDAVQGCAKMALMTAYDITLAHVRKLEEEAKAKALALAQEPQPCSSI